MSADGSDMPVAAVLTLLGVAQLAGAVAVDIDDGQIVLGVISLLHFTAAGCVLRSGMSESEEAKERKAATTRGLALLALFLALIAGMMFLQYGQWRLVRVDLFPLGHVLDLPH